jgi:hypothetical protein
MDSPMDNKGEGHEKNWFYHIERFGELHDDICFDELCQ